MVNFQAPKSHIHVIARGFFVHGEKIILCRVKGAKWFFLPGGHVEDGESARAALLRELREEIGNDNFKVTSFIGMYENVFSLEGSVLQHEISIVFKVDIPHELKINTKEDHIEFVSVEKTALEDYKILPATLKEGLLEWLEDGRAFLREI